MYGVDLASDFVFSNRLAAGSGTGRPLSFECVLWEQARQFPEPGELAYRSPAGTDGRSSVAVYRVVGAAGEGLLVRFRTADFCLEPERVVCRLSEERYRYLVEIQLFGIVLALWLEWRGVPALHASAVAVGGRIAGFLATSGGGKSSIAMSLVRDGHPLLTDDILPVESSGGRSLGFSGYPGVRMWPDQVRRFLGSCAGTELVHPGFSKRRVHVGACGVDGFGSFCDGSLPLGCLYLPQRRAGKGEVEISNIPRREALMYLIGNSFVAPVVAALGLQPGRMAHLADLLSHTPVRHLSYPDGFDNLPKLNQAILEDLDSLEERV